MALAPALAWYATPVAPLVAVAVAAIAIAAALHGLGRAVGALVGDRDGSPALAIAWGLAAYLGLAGALAAIGCFDRAAQRIVMVAATGIGAAWCGRAIVTARVRDWRAWRPSLALVVTALAIAVVALHVAGAAGTQQGRFFDGEVYQLGPLARLGATGDLGDAFAVPRTGGLGGGVLVSTLAAAFDDLRMVHAIDRGLALGLALALALGGLRRGPMRFAIGGVIVALASAVPELASDLAPQWSIVALVFALHQTLARAHAAGRTPWAAVIVAAALAGVRHEGLAVVIVIGAHAIATAPARRRAAAIVVGIVACALGGLIVAALVAHAREPASTSMLAALTTRTALRLLLSGVAAAVLHALMTLALRGAEDRAFAVTVAAICAALAATGALAPPAELGGQLVPYGIALALLLIAPALTRGVQPLTIAVLLLIGLALATTRFPIGQPPLSWEARLGRMLDAGRALSLGTGDEPHERAVYAAAFGAVPPGARVGLWVDRGDLAEYGHPRVIDLRSAATTACIDDDRSSASPACARLTALLPRLGLDYLIVSSSSVRDPGAPGSPVDPLAAFVAGARTVATPDGLTVYALRR
ncbi:MAG: hypothetical protein K8W52_27825 [Deltaproteobacteria bacterium]|nr:hypothetical protein [Deltaproteobacteria bacterium]